MSFLKSNLPDTITDVYALCDHCEGTGNGESYPHRERCEDGFETVTNHHKCTECAGLGHEPEELTLAEDFEAGKDYIIINELTSLNEIARCESIVSSEGEGFDVAFKWNKVAGRYLSRSDWGVRF